MNSSNYPDLLGYVLIAAAAALSYLLKKLTFPACISGFAVASAILNGTGYQGLLLLAFFFVAGNVATAWKSKIKQQLTVATDKSARTSGQVFANGGVAATCGLLAHFYPGYLQLFSLMIAGSLASATADTLSSELGSVYGSRFYDVISFKRSPPGPDGVLSVEGTLIGVLGAILMAVIYSVGTRFGATFFVIVFAGALGNLADSLLGATLERKRLIGNNTVNFLNTLTGALVCLVYVILVPANYHLVI